MDAGDADIHFFIYIIRNLRWHLTKLYAVRILLRAERIFTIMVDLHVHSTCSDGTYTPEELVDYAREKGLRAFALTDHDTVNGLDRVIQYAEKLRQTQAASPVISSPNDAGCSAASRLTVPSQSGSDSSAPKAVDVSKACSIPFPVDTDTPRRANIPRTCGVPSAPGADVPSVPEVIPGIELSTEYQGKDIHMVGLFIDYHQPDFSRYLEDFIRSRENRNEKMCALLREHGIAISYETLLSEFPGAVITRAHFARYLLYHGYIQSMKEAFDRYVGDHCPCFVPREKVTPAQAVKLILGAGGVPVLAHPILYHMSDERLENLVKELKSIGLAGIEAIYSTYNTAEERQIRGLASKYGLKISGGSDFHGANKPKIDLGTGWGKLYVPDEVLENLRPDR